MQRSLSWSTTSDRPLITKASLILCLNVPLGSCPRSAESNSQGMFYSVFLLRSTVRRRCLIDESNPCKYCMASRKTSCQKWQLTRVRMSGGK